mmetsp:Transcript_72154/g.222913  ORF Transcript_72154/g.222913 Transcript_72154/m.222913 type:complete len:400 (+) Transcript_72154:48-1247(+)
MLAALQGQKNRLKAVDPGEVRAGAGQPSEPGPAQASASGDISPEEQQRIREDFFAAGLEKWLPLVADLSFPSASLPLSHECCQALARAACPPASASDTSAASAFDGGQMAQQIDAALAERGWSKAFVKLSTRSPKDSPLILARASEAFRAEERSSLPLAERARLFAELVQRQFSVASGTEAVELLTTSDRVREDLEYALEAPRYEDLGLHVVLRRWDGPIPIANEFRGIVWKSSLNAVGQYYHPLAFPELAAVRGEIEADLRGVYQGLQGKLEAAGFTHFIVDFAWLGPGDVKVIEINPFDGVALGCFPASTGLFKWEDERDRKIITEGPFELRLRQEPLPDHELKHRLNPAWRDIIEPPTAVARKSASVPKGPPRPKGAAPPPPPPPRQRPSQSEAAA